MHCETCLYGLIVEIAPQQIWNQYNVFQHNQYTGSKFVHQILTDDHLFSPYGNITG